MAYVFISYSRRDKVTMECIKMYLEDHGVEVWTDRGIEPGSPEWEPVIEERLSECGCVVVLLSPDSKQSKWVNTELAIAEDRVKQILPVIVRGNSQDAVPPRLFTYNWIDLNTDTEIGLTRLLESIRQSLKLSPRNRFKNVLVPSKNFSQGFDLFTQGRDSFEQIDIFSHTATMYSFAIQQNQLKAKNMRLLMRDISDPDRISFPTEEQDKKALQDHSNTQISLIQKRTDQLVDALHIRFFGFDPLFHFIIFDKSELYWGLLAPSVAYPGSELLSTYNIDETYEEGRTLVYEFLVFFERVWNDFSYPLNS